MIEPAKHGRKLERCAQGEDHRCGKQSREVFAKHEHRVWNGREQVEAKALVEHFTAEKVREHILNWRGSRSLEARYHR